MKSFSTIFLLFFTLVSFCQSEVKNVDVEKSTVTWKGTKLIGGSHAGNIKLISGFLSFTDDKISGGKFVINMKAISSTDLKGKSKLKIEKHLKASRFFGVEKHPTSSFLITKISYISDNQYQITGNFTIKDISKSNTFILKITKHTASGKIILKRKDFNIRYGSGFFGSIADKGISNKFVLNINLIF